MRLMHQPPLPKLAESAVSQQSTAIVLITTVALQAGAGNGTASDTVNLFTPLPSVMNQGKAQLHDTKCDTLDGFYQQALTEGHIYWVCSGSSGLYFKFPYHRKSARVLLPHPPAKSRIFVSRNGLTPLKFSMNF